MISLYHTLKKIREYNTMIINQAEQERKNQICHSNPVYEEKKVLKLKNLKGLGSMLGYTILLRYSRGWYYLKIMAAEMGE